MLTTKATLRFENLRTSCYFPIGPEFPKPGKMYADEDNKIFTFDNSTVAVPCDRKLYYSRELNLKKKIEKTSTYFGTAIHKFCEAFWMGEDHFSCIQTFRKHATAANSPILDDPDSDEQRTVQRGIDVCKMYIKRYDADRMVTKIIHLNGEPLVEVGFSFILGVDEDGWTYIYCGRIDRVEEHRGVIRVVDTKTTTRFGATYWKRLRPNAAITGYVAGLRELTGIVTKHAALDVIYIGEPRKRDEKTGNYRLPKAVKEAGQEAIDDWVANIQCEHGPTQRTGGDISQWWRNTILKGIRLRKLFQQKDIAEWVMEEEHCTAYGECDFRDICILEANQEPVIQSLYEVKPWRPFELEEVVHVEAA